MRSWLLVYKYRGDDGSQLPGSTRMAAVGFSNMRAVSLAWQIREVSHQCVACWGSFADAKSSDDCAEGLIWKRRQDIMTTLSSQPYDTLCLPRCLLPDPCLGNSVAFLLHHQKLNMTFMGVFKCARLPLGVLMACNWAGLVVLGQQYLTVYFTPQGLCVVRLHPPTHLPPSLNSSCNSLYYKQLTILLQ